MRELPFTDPEGRAIRFCPICGEFAAATTMTCRCGSPTVELTRVTMDENSTMTVYWESEIVSDDKKLVIRTFEYGE